MALASNALTRIDDVREYLGVEGSSQDKLLEGLINAASNQIESYCGRSFGREVITAESVAGYGGVRLWVSKFPIDAAEPITITLDGFEFDSDDFAVETHRGSFYNPSGWPSTAPVVLAANPYRVHGDERAAYLVSYTAGYVLPPSGVNGEFLPADIQLACHELVSSMYRRQRRDPSIRSEKLLSYAVTYEPDAGKLPASVMSLLDSYSAPVQA